MMEVSKRRTAARNVVAGSVWESRMKMDEVKGGIKVFNGDENSEEGNYLGNESVKQNHSVVREKRKTWKCEPVIDPILIRKIRSDESSEEFHDSVDGFGKDPIRIRNSGSDESSKEILNEPVDAIEKTPIHRRKSKSHSHKIADETREIFNGYVMDEVVVKEEIKVSKKTSEVKEVKLSELKPKKVFISKEKINQIPKTTIPISAIVNKKQNLGVNQPISTKPSTVKVPGKLDIIRETQNKFKSLVDIVMWTDIIKSSLVFGIGSVLLLSPLLKDINFSLISVISYLGLLCIAAIFLYKAILTREPINLDESNLIHSVGEEEAICLVKVVLPWLNKFILEIRYLLFGDPATTMKFAVLLFLVARLGSFITLWRVTILCFYGVLTLPKLYSTYSKPLNQEGILWLSRCRNAWNSYTFMKAIVAAVFTLIWSSSSTIVRVWEVFMLIIAIKYYQETLINSAENERDKVDGDCITKESTEKDCIKKEETGMESEWLTFFS